MNCKFWIPRGEFPGCVFAILNIRVVLGAIVVGYLVDKGVDLEIGLRFTIKEGRTNIYVPGTIPH